MKRTAIILSAAVLVAALVFCLAQPLFAAPPVWVEGKVTARPWVKRYRYIEVDGKIYTLMKDARISLRYQDRPGALNDRTIGFYEIREGHHIMMRVQGSRVHQVLIYE